MCTSSKSQHLAERAPLLSLLFIHHSACVTRADNQSPSAQITLAFHCSRPTTARTTTTRRARRFSRSFHPVTQTSYNFIVNQTSALLSHALMHRFLCSAPEASERRGDRSMIRTISGVRLCEVLSCSDTCSPEAISHTVNTSHTHILYPRFRLFRLVLESEQDARNCDPFTAQCRQSEEVQSDVGHSLPRSEATGRWCVYSMLYVAWSCSRSSASTESA
jgi:hypothetical protein